MNVYLFLVIYCELTYSAVQDPSRILQLKYYNYEDFLTPSSCHQTEHHSAAVRLNVAQLLPDCCSTFHLLIYISNIYVVGSLYSCRSHTYLL